MRVKIIDRYLIREFIEPFVYCTTAFFLLYLVADLLEHMDEFLRARLSFFDVLRYYASMVPMIVLETAPFAVVLSLIFELGQFARHLEIVGMKASGIAPKRIALPFIMTGLAITFFYLLFNETVIPRTNAHLDHLRRTYFQSESAGSAGIYKDLTHSNVKESYVLYMGRVNPATLKAHEIQIHYLSPTGTVQRLIRARSGRWLEGQWWLFNGTIALYTEDGDIRGEIKPFKKLMAAIRENPMDLIREEKAAQQMNFLEYRSALLKKFGASMPSTQRIQLYSKLSAPWTCFFLILAVVPFGLRISRGGALSALGKTLLITLAFFMSGFVASAMGKQGYLPAVIACTLPHLLFGAYGVYNLARLK